LPAPKPAGDGRSRELSQRSGVPKPSNEFISRYFGARSRLEVIGVAGVTHDAPLD
jgi:hypothetical protein